MRRRLVRLTLAALAILPFFTARASAHDGQVSQSIQTLPQVPGDPGIGLSAHKPTAIRAYVQAQRYLHISLFGFTFHLPVFTPVSVDGTLIVKQGATTIATLTPSNGPISVAPWST